MNIEERFDKIEAYVLGTLNEVEKENFEQEISADKELATEVQLHKMEHEAMRILDRDHLKAQFSNWATEKQQQEQSSAKIVKMSSSRRLITRRLSIAASFLVLLIAGFGLIQNNYSNNALANELMPPTNWTDRGSMDGNPIEIAFEAMENKNYEEAIQIFDDLKNTQYAETALLYKAEAYYLSENYQLAESNYQTIVNENKSTANIHKAERGLVATFLKQNKTEAAITLLTSIAQNETHTYQKEAQIILEKQESWLRKLVVSKL